MEKNKEYLINYFLIDNKSGYKTKEKHIIKNFDGLLDEINEYNNRFEESIPFTQKLYNYLYNINKYPKCETCGSPIKWKNRFSEGYQSTCSKKCRGKSSTRVNKIKKTVKEKYGVEWISSNDDVKNKKKKIYLDKFGNENIFQSKEIKKKINKTNKEKYGTVFPSQSKTIQDKIKTNNLKKYGIDSPSKLDSVKEKTKITNIKKYGYSSVMNNPNIKSKNIKSRTKKTIERYKEALGDFDIEYDTPNLIIKNQCSKHSEYVINNTLFYYRVLIYKFKNPCIYCNPINHNVSIQENEVKEFIESLGINVEKKHINGFEIDIFLPDYNIGFEYNGLYWHSELYKDKNYHLNKTNMMNNEGIKLYHIFEDEWIHKRPIVESIVKNKIGVITNRIYARKCKIKEVSSIDSLEFLDKNHIQGNINSKIRIGLYYEDELVSLMTFSKEKRKKIFNKDDNEYELLRFCNKNNFNVVGGASKLLKYFTKNFSYNKISTFADLRYSSGDLYHKLGFNIVYSIEPNYWYCDLKNKLRFHRFNYRKSILVKKGHDRNKTEKEIMSESNMVRIYDCGNLKFEISL